MKNLYALFLSLIFSRCIFALEYNAELRGLSDGASHKARVGVVTIEGPIEEARYYVDELVTFFRDPSIRALLLVIDSPGGSPGASEAIYRVIREYKEKYKKPVIVFVESLCASGGYFIAAAADCIISTESALVGSVGVIWQTWRLKKFIEQIGIKREIVTAGLYKAVGNSYLEGDNKEHQEYIQALLKDHYDIFLELVVAGRPSLAQVSPDLWANGKIFVGRKAFEIGLVDKIGAFPTVKKTIKESANIVGNIDWVHLPKPDQNLESQEKASNSEKSLMKQLISEFLANFHVAAGPRAEYIP